MYDLSHRAKRDKRNTRSSNKLDYTKIKPSGEQNSYLNKQN